MVEAELAPTGLANLLELVERLVKFILRSVLTKCQEELQYFEKYPESKKPKKIISKLTALLQKNFR
jgi:aspartyl/asparaginyl-tRNA synthetase